MSFTGIFKAINPAGPLRSLRLLSARRVPAGGAVAMAMALVLLPLLGACSDNGPKWHGVDIKGVMPDLSFTMTRASDGKTVTQDDYRNAITLLYFGYTYCPDICPLTLANVTQVLQKLGKDADAVRVLFVTVDPDRDSLKVLSDYTDAFSPRMVGLRGTPDQLASLAKRYRAAFSVHKDAKTGEIVVTHSSAIYVFDREGKARLLVTNFSQQDADIDGTTEDLQRLIDARDGSSWMDWLRGLI